MYRCHERPLLQRALFLLMGLLTVFCAGCCGYEAILAGDQPTEPTYSAPAVVAGTTIGATQDDSATQGDCNCGCLSCHFSITFAFRPALSATLVEVGVFGDMPASSEHTAAPLVPPPQA